MNQNFTIRSPRKEKQRRAFTKARRLKNDKEGNKRERVRSDGQARQARSSHLVHLLREIGPRRNVRYNVRERDGKLDR